MSGRFGRKLALFYGTLFGLVGTHLPFFPVWLKAIGIDASWIGIITAVPSVTRFTALPFVTGLAERRYSVRAALTVTAFATAAGFSLVGTQNQPLLVFLAYVVTACVWTPMVPLTDAYALNGVARYGLNYGRVRLWGSAAFVMGAFACGLLVDLIEAKHLIWVIAAVAALGFFISLALEPLDQVRSARAAPSGDTALLRDRGFLAFIVAAGLIQSSHAAYYTFASIAWQSAGLGGLTIAGLWALGVLAEIAVFAASPLFTWQPSLLMAIGAFSAMARWLITAQQPSLAVLSLVQLAHGLSFGLTQVGTMGLMVRHVPVHTMGRGQGYLVACNGIIASSAAVLSGAIYARYGEGVYYVMAAMALSGAILTCAGPAQIKR
jgi:PPP family 3-phenylpropionic acid transporter